MIAAEMPQTIDSILRGVERIATLARGVKSLSRQPSGEEWCNLNDCVEQVLLMARHFLGEEIAIRRQLAADLPDIPAAVVRIEQVLINLLINAADACREHAGKGEILLWTEADTGEVRLLVEDDGPGLPVDAEAIWEPFFTTKPAGQGTGLGLAIVRSIIRECGGRVTAENRPTGGARFTVSVPTEVGIGGGGRRPIYLF